ANLTISLLPDDGEDGGPLTPNALLTIILLPDGPGEPSSPAERLRDEYACGLPRLLADSSAGQPAELRAVVRAPHILMSWPARQSRYVSQLARAGRRGPRGARC